MDCHRPSAFAMTKGAKDDDFFLFSVIILAINGYGLLRRFAPRNDKGGKGWYSQTRHCESCLQLVAISVWGIIIHS